MKVLYVSGSDSAVPDTTAEQLARVSPDLEIRTVATAAEALKEARTPGGFRALLTSHVLPPNDTLSVISALRRERVPMAIVPVLTETQREFFASAVAAGADDVLLLRGGTLLCARETLTRINQSAHLLAPAESRRLRVLYAGTDDHMWRLLEQVPFTTVERATVAADGSIPMRDADPASADPRCDAVVIDQQRGETHPLHVLKAVRAQAADLPVILLIAPDATEVETQALDLGAEDIIVKQGAYRRRVIATLRRCQQRADVLAEHGQLRQREHRLRHLVETLPEGVLVISEDCAVLAMNAAALAIVGAARPADVVSRDLRSLVVIEHRDRVRDGIASILSGETTAVTFDIGLPDEARRPVELRGVVLERDARGRRGVSAVLRVVATDDRDASAAAEGDRAAAAQAEIESLRRTADTAITALETERAAREDRERRLDAAEADLVRRRDAEAALADALTRERGGWEDEKGTLDGKLQALRAEQEVLQKVLESERLATTELRASLEEAQKALDEARTTLAREQRSGGEVRAALEEARRNVEEMHRNLDEAQRTLERERLAVAAAVPVISTAPEPAAAPTATPASADRLAEELRLARRLEEVGSLAAAMAPDIQQWIEEAYWAAKELIETAAADDPRRRTAVAAATANETASALVRQLVSFGRRQAAPPDRVELADVVARLESTIGRLIGVHIDFETDFRIAGHVVLSVDDLDELLTELAVLARDLLPFGGRLRLETGPAANAKATARVAIIAAGYGVRKAEIRSPLDTLTRRCGGVLQTRNDTERQTIIEVLLPADGPAAA